MSERLRVGFVGLGDQGVPMADRVLGGGWPLSIFARRPEVRARYEGLGATSCASLRELGERSDMVAVVVVDDAQVREVVVEEGVLAGMPEGGVLVIHSTIHPETCRELGTLAAKQGVTVLDAPVTGALHGTSVGPLTVMVGGEQEAYDRVLPVLSTYGTLVRRVGPLGAGQLAKIINNFTYAAQLAVANDVERLVRALGLDLDAAAEVLPTGSGSSWVLGRLAQAGFDPPEHDRGVAYAVGLVAKDVGLLRELAGPVVDELLSNAMVSRMLDRARTEAGTDSPTRIKLAR